MDIKCFCLCHLKWGSDFIFQKTNFENARKLESIVNICLFYKNFMPKQRIPNHKAKNSHTHPTTLWNNFSKNLSEV